MYTNSKNIVPYLANVSLILEAYFFTPRDYFLVLNIGLKDLIKKSSSKILELEKNIINSTS